MHEYEVPASSFENSRNITQLLNGAKGCQRRDRHGHEFQVKSAQAPMQLYVHDNATVC
jgi:hypothetical protein